METNLAFILKNILLGVLLAFVSFSVSHAHRLIEPNIRKRKMCRIAGTFAFFQAFMPMAGWVCVHTIVQYFTAFSKFIPYIAFVLLAYIGGKMLLDAFHPDDEEIKPGVGFAALFVQGIATSIDALSVGFTIAEYNWLSALVASLIIAAVTFVVCTIGLVLGKKFGTSLSGKAQILGGVILIFIGIEILVKGIM